MNMEAIHKYVINLSKEEVTELHEIIGAIPKEYVLNSLKELHNTMATWIDVEEIVPPEQEEVNEPQ